MNERAWLWHIIGAQKMMVVIGNDKMKTSSLKREQHSHRENVQSPVCAHGASVLGRQKQ